MPKARDTDDSPPRPRVGCNIPSQVVCRITVPATKEDGIPLYCSATPPCPWNGSLVHAKCLERLEEVLKKEIEATGRGRKWTEKQLYDNVWTKRCPPNIKSTIRCQCGKGVLDKREDGRKLDKEPEPVAPNGRRKKGKNLPSLVTRLVPVQKMGADELERMKKLNKHYLSKHSEGSEDEASEHSPPGSNDRSRSVSVEMPKKPQPYAKQHSLEVNDDEWPAPPAGFRSGSADQEEAQQSDEEVDDEEEEEIDPKLYDWNFRPAQSRPGAIVDLLRHFGLGS
ncbi:hypothetical protein M3Y99_01649200 [Aphelenchoides fujianensis]|nr:hypothetical protein M3Y99_01649200 [Aphelenchoides fujianensis]